MSEENGKSPPYWLWLVVFIPAWLIVRSILGVDGWVAILVAGVFGAIVSLFISIAYARMTE